MFDAVKRHGIAAGFIVLTLIVLGAFCVYLNREFYLRYGAFFDSLSYDQTLVRVMLNTRMRGLSAGFAMTSSSTVMLPWLQTMLLAPFTPPGRAIGVWLQISWMIVTALAGYGYFRRVIHYDRLTASSCSLLFFFIASTFYWDGGVSDFRMDYFQYIFFGLIFYIYSIAYRDGRVFVWVIWGGAVALAFLARATTPVYVALVYGPFFLIDLWHHRTPVRDIVVRYAAGGLTCIVLCSWFFIIRGEFLYDYYFLWNTDAHANLPLTESWYHLGYVFDEIGAVAALTGAAVFALNIGLWAAGRRGGRWNFRALWVGIAPVGFLVLSGAGLNPFVSEVAAFGFLLFLVAPVEARKVSRLRAGTTVSALLVVAVFGCYTGFKIHTDDDNTYVYRWVPAHRALVKLARCLVHDVEQNAPGNRHFVSLFSGSMNSDVLMDFLIFDDGRTAEVDPDGSLYVAAGHSTLSISPVRSDVIFTPPEWAATPGADDAAKVALLAEKMAEASDYFIIPSPDTALFAHLTVNQYVKEISEKLAEDVYLKPLCGQVRIRDGEFVTLYRKDVTKPPLGGSVPGSDVTAIEKAARPPAAPTPPASVDGFPGDLKQPGLFFAGVTQQGWLADKAHVVLALSGTSDRLHIVGTPGRGAKIAAGTMRITVDGVSVLERPEGIESFDLAIPIPPAEGPRKIELVLTGIEPLAEADNRPVSVQLSAIGLEHADPPTAQ